MNKSPPKFIGELLSLDSKTKQLCTVCFSGERLWIRNGTDLNLDLELYKRTNVFSWTLNGQNVQKLSITNQTTNYQFQTINDSLSKLKLHLDGKVPYQKFNQLYLPLKKLKSTKNGQILLVKNLITYKEEVAKFRKKQPNESEADMKEFDHELNIQEKLSQSPHPNILKLECYFLEGNAIILILEYCQVPSLHKYLSQCQNKIPLSACKIMMKKILKGIKAIHEAGIMHRDLKLDNILIQNIQNIKSIKIIDFGFACQLNELSGDHHKCGTPGYIAPEVFEDEDYNELCDIFSIGAIFHKLLTGKGLFTQNPNQDVSIMILNQNNQFKICADQIPSVLALDLIEKMTYVKEFRYNAEECLKHDFFKKSDLEHKIQSLPALTLKTPFLK